MQPSVLFRLGRGGYLVGNSPYESAVKFYSNLSVTGSNPVTSTISPVPLLISTQMVFFSGYWNVEESSIREPWARAITRYISYTLVARYYGKVSAD